MLPFVQDNFALVRSMLTVKPIIVKTDIISREDSIIKAVVSVDFSALKPAHTTQRSIGNFTQSKLSLLQQ